MPFELFADVILTRDVANRGLRAGDVGTVVERHTAPGMIEEGYFVAARKPSSWRSQDRTRFESKELRSTNLRSCLPTRA
ncbi:MAG: hypothetical protein DMG00_30605 [Acidobacteria bacterium]|nr:MAG: hypothetical protein DMG00_30605 [Acidobacteriota bacterium]